MSSLWSWPSWREKSDRYELERLQRENEQLRRVRTPLEIAREHLAILRRHHAPANVITVAEQLCRELTPPDATAQ